MSIEAMKQALEALEYIYTETTEEEDKLIHAAITALRLAIEQAERVKRAEEAFAAASDEMKGEQAEKQAPVGEVLNERGDVDYLSYVPPAGTPLYAAPPQRQPLTEEEIVQIVRDELGYSIGSDDVAFARAIERAHGIGGGE